MLCNFPKFLQLYNLKDAMEITIFIKIPYVLKHQAQAPKKIITKNNSGKKQDPYRDWMNEIVNVRRGLRIEYCNS